MSTSDVNVPCLPGDTREGEVLSGEIVQINPDLSAYVSKPAQKPLAAIILIHDIFGFELPATRVFADVVASRGYLAVVPDLFRGNPWPTAVNPVIRGADYKAWLSSHGQSRVDGDLDAALDYVRRLDVQRVGTAGFCWGGNQIVLAAARLASRFQAAVGFYGVFLTPDLVLAVRTPTLLIFAENDGVIPVDGVKTLSSVVGEAGRIVSEAGEKGSSNENQEAAPIRIKIFADVGHGFTHRGDRNDPTIEVAAKESIEDMFTWIDHYLGT